MKCSKCFKNLWFFELNGYGLCSICSQIKMSKKEEEDKKNFDELVDTLIDIYKKDEDKMIRVVAVLSILNSVLPKELLSKNI